MPVTPVRYFATAFFSPFYFAPLAATIPSDPTGIGVLPYGDKEAFEAIISILNSTGVFADVLFGITPEQRTTPADVAPLALIQPQYWNEFDDADPNVLIRQVSYSLTLIVRDDDPFTRYAQLEGLTALAQDSLNNSDLGGGAIAPLTILRRGALNSSSNPPEQSVVLDGEFAYMIPSMTSHVS